MINHMILRELLGHLYKESLLREIFKLVYPNGGRISDLKINEITEIHAFSDELFKMFFAVFMWRLNTTAENDVVQFIENDKINNIHNLLEGMYLVIENCWVPNSKMSDPQSGLDRHYSASLRLIRIFDCFLTEENIEDNLIKRIKQRLILLSTINENIEYYENALFSLTYCFGIIIHRKLRVNNETVKYLTSLTLNNELPISIRKASKRVLLEDIYPSNKLTHYLDFPLNEKLFENLHKIDDGVYASTAGFDQGEKYNIIQH